MIGRPAPDEEPPALRRRTIAARAHAGVVSMVEWYRDTLVATGRMGIADRLRLLSAGLVRRRSSHPGTVAAIEAVRDAVRELAKTRPDRNRIVVLLGAVADGADDADLALESVKAVIAELARHGPGGGDPATAG